MTLHSPDGRARRILLVEGTGRGFINQYTHALALALSRDGCRVSLLTGPADEFADRKFPFAKPGPLRHGIAGWLRLARMVKPTTCDVVHFQWMDNLWFGLPIVRLWQQRGIKVIYTPHNILPHCSRWLCMPIYRAWYRSVDGIVARDKHICWALEEVLEIPKERLVVVEENPNLLAELDGSAHVEGLPERKPDELRVLFFGHGGRGKGLQELLTALGSRDWERPVHFVIAGEQVQRGVDRGVLQRAQSSVRVTVLNRYIEPEQVTRLFRTADLLALPYLKICKSPLVDLAADLGLPVLRSDRVQAACFEEGCHGVTVPHGDHEALQSALGSLDSDERILARMREWLYTYHSTGDRVRRLVGAHRSLYGPSARRYASGVPLTPVAHRMVAGAAGTPEL